MNLRTTLVAFIKVVGDEAERNAEFRSRLQIALGLENVESSGAVVKRKGGRRTPAVIDPVDLAREGEPVLRERLLALDLEQLRDIVAQYGMDPGKLVMKWKHKDRVIDRIVEISASRSTKGDAFRKD